VVASETNPALAAATAVAIANVRVFIFVVLLALSVRDPKLFCRMRKTPLPTIVGGEPTRRLHAIRRSIYRLARVGSTPSDSETVCGTGR